MNLKKAKDEEEAWNIAEKYENKPHGWVQWKGTEVCMDFHCSCGFQGHIDGSNIYFVQCSKCGRKYFCNGHIELVQVEKVIHADIHIVEE